MSSLIPVATRALITLCDACNTIETAAKVLNPNASPYDCSVARQASLVSNLVLFGFSLVEIGMALSGESSASLLTLKVIEVIPRVLNIPIQFANEAVHGEPNKRGFLKACEKGLIAPIAGMMVTCIEGSIYQEGVYLELGPEGKRPIYDTAHPGDPTEIIGMRPVDPEECRQNIAMLQTSLNIATLVRTTGEFKAVTSFFCDIGVPVCERLARFFGRQTPNPQPAAPPPQPAPQQAPQAIHQPQDFNLLNLDRIPEPLHGDQIFRRYICLITGLPIRDPVSDPTIQQVSPDAAPVYYDRWAITAWLQIRQISPANRRPLTVDQLQEVPWLRNLINKRLEHHQEQLDAYLQGLNLPLSPEEEAILNQAGD